ncbi:MAG: molecular chaperone [Ignavibacteriae bacterium]|nr:molecular chaperone [Ignavibacteriota bacterium]
MNVVKSLEGQSFYKLEVRLLIIILVLILSQSVFSEIIFAQRDLVIFPQRVVFEDNKRMQVLNLANTGEEVAKYNISIVQIRMKEDGGFENITEPDSGQFFADPYLRIYPRTVTLAPKETQVVKVQLRKKNLLTEGEYRSHIYFRGVLNEGALKSDSKDSLKDVSGVVVRLVPIYGVTIPAIIRVGESTTEVNLSNLSFEMKNNTTPTIKFDINRKGNMSVYGDIEVDYIPQEGEVSHVGKIKGVAVYTPNQLRRCILNLKNIKDVSYNKGKLVLKYLDKREDKGAKLAEVHLQL